MSDWKEGFREAIAKVVAEKGVAINSDRIDERYGYAYATGWTWGLPFHDNWRKISEHQKTCNFTASTAKDIEWNEFDGTDEPSRDRHGLYMISSCECGEWQDVTFVYEGTLGAVLQSLLEA